MSNLRSRLKFHSFLLGSSLALLGGCASTGDSVKAVGSSQSQSADKSATGTSSGFTDDDFKIKEIIEAAAPVYIPGINHDAQDAFREGVQTVSLSNPDFAHAAAKFKEAAERSPEFLEAYFNWGQALERQGKSQEALGVYEKALANNPGDPSATAYIAKVYLGNARAASFLGKTQEARDWTQKAHSLLQALVEQDPNNVPVNNAMALYYLMEGDVDTAERFVKEVLYVEPSNVTGLNTRGLINLKRGQLLIAKWIFENKVLREDPSSTEAHTNLGYTYIKLDERSLAMRHFMKAVEYDPENMEARMNIAAMLLEHLDYENALEHYQKVLQAQPNDAEAQLGRCDAIYGKAGSSSNRKVAYEESVPCYDAFVAKHPERTDLIKRNAETYQNHVQNLEKAISYFKLYGEKASLSGEDKTKNDNVIKVLSDIVASGGLDAMMNNSSDDAEGLDDMDEGFDEIEE